jgi:hypothetical protein
MTFALVLLVYDNGKIVVHKIEHVQVLQFLRRCMAFLQLSVIKNKSLEASSSSSLSSDPSTSSGSLLDADGMTFRETIVVGDNSTMELKQKVFDLDDDERTLKAVYIFEYTSGIAQQLQNYERKDSIEATISEKQMWFRGQGFALRSPEDSREDIGSYYKSLDWNFFDTVLIPGIRQLPEFQSFVSTTTQNYPTRRGIFAEQLLNPYLDPTALYKSMKTFYGISVPIETKEWSSELIKTVVIMENVDKLGRFFVLKFVETKDEKPMVTPIDEWKLPTRQQVERELSLLKSKAAVKS